MKPNLSLVAGLVVASLIAIAPGATAGPQGGIDAEGTLTVPGVGYCEIEIHAEIGPFVGVPSPPTIEKNCRWL